MFTVFSHSLTIASKKDTYIGSGCVEHVSIFGKMHLQHMNSLSPAKFNIGRSLITHSIQFTADLGMCQIKVQPPGQDQLSESMVFCRGVQFDARENSTRVCTIFFFFCTILVSPPPMYDAII